MDSCIFCGEAIKQGINDSIEHIFPKAIGGTFTIRNVCRGCNNSLGRTVDHWFLEEPLIKLCRMLYQLEGESGSIPTVYDFPLYDEQGNRAILGHGDGVTVPTVYDDYEARNTSVQLMDDGHIQFHSSSPEHVKRKLKKIGVLPEDIDKIISKGRREYTLEKYKFAITFDKINCLPCLYKIAFEYACTSLGYKALSDDTIVSIREYLLRCMNNEHPAPPSIIEPKINDGEFFPSVSSYHTIQLDRDEEKLFVRIVLFGKALFEIPMSENLELLRDDGRIHAIMEPINPLIVKS
ncbi:MAG: HNH endonuclease [Clostridia bacterium]|nr:HNH endonuclease [Clostridia bacterium]